MPEAHHPHAFSRIAEELVADLRGIASEEPKRSRKRETQPLAAVVEQLLQKHQIGRSTPEDALRERWVEIVGAANASYSHAVTIERNRLLVVTSHAIVRNELFLHKEEILSRIQAVKGCEHVKSIHLRNG
ncbi:DUF721 domain-containing protein [Opitutus sp. ER46]|uniref:DUF721 domain-containing protein n=1 Tax=Opitutus sp. ER46 TaxID=2161864 RepID=UPI000D2FF560|nr:DUF721 domain-containing protein [Opitutus sp. ER46]PTX92538.1 DUF721 domain-containing protein [Opitutus sp. ER46]